MRRRDRGGREASWRAAQRLQATEQTLELTPEHVARVLQQAISREGGELRQEANGIYRFRKVPASWKKLVKETIERQGMALPKLVFDPTYFEAQNNGRTIFKPRTDAVLIRLGHPLMQRAIGTLRRNLWKDEGMTRWTIQQCALPSRSRDLLLLSLLLEVTNEFHEIAHQEVLLVPFEIHGNTLYEVEPALWQELKPLPRTMLSEEALKIQIPRIRSLWASHEQQIRDIVRQRRDGSRREFTQLLRSRLRQEQKQERAMFEERLRELERQKQPRYLLQLRREIERQRKKLSPQLSLFEDIQIEQLETEQRLQEMEWQLEHNYIDRMKSLVQEEQTRIIQEVLPRRYALATVDVQPLTVEYIVRVSGSSGKEQQ